MADEQLVWWRRWLGVGPATADDPEAAATVPLWVRVVDVVGTAALVISALAWWRISGPGDQEAELVAWLVLGAFCAWNQALRSRALHRVASGLGG